MGRSVRVETDVIVYVDLEDIDTDDLVEELKSRGKTVLENLSEPEQLIKIYHLRRLGKSFDSELDKYLSDMLGKVV